jgi:catecholate siderophore receptor
MAREGGPVHRKRESGVTQKFEQRKTRRGWELQGSWKLSGKAAAAVLMAAGAAMLPVMAGAQKMVSGPSGNDALLGAREDAAVMADADPEGDGKNFHHFQIASGSLTDVLDAYRQTTGIVVTATISKDKLAGFQSKGVQGAVSDATALQLILDGTGLSYKFDGPQRVSVGIRNAEHVDVTTSVSSINMQQFPESLLDTAQTVTTVPQFVMQDEQSTTLRDALRNVPGVTMAAGEGGSQGDTLTIRGFSARNDIFLDGIRDFGNYYRDSFDYENVDVLEGPAGVEFGRGSTGGVVNQESKEPEGHKFVHTDLQLGTDAMRRLTVDANGPLQNVQNAAVRVNLVGEQSMYAGRDVSEIRRFGVAPAIIFGLNTPTRFELQYLHESENSTPDYGLPYFGAAVAKVRGANFYGFASDNYLRTSPDVVTAKVEHDLGSVATVRNVLRWANYPRDVRVTEPQVNTAAVLNTASKTYVAGTPVVATCDPTLVNNPVATATNPTVSAACYPLNTPLSVVQVKQNELNVRSTEDMLWDQVSATGHFNFLHIANDGIILLEGGRERSNPTRNSYTMPYVSLLSPNPYAAFAPAAASTGLTGHVTTQSFGLGFNDTLKLRDWLLLSGGVRFDYFSTTAVNIPSTTAVTGCVLNQYCTAERLDKQPTYRASLVVKPKPQGSVYFDYGTSFNPSAESLSLSGNNATAAPEENFNLEFGAKWSYFRDRLNLNGSIFRTEKDNAHETDPNNALNTLTVGTYLVRGVQLGGLGHLPQHFDVVFGYAYLDAELQNSLLNASPFAAANIALIALHDPRANTGPFFINPNGAPIAQVAKNTGNLFVTHSIWKGFVGGFGGNYTSARRASSGTMVGLYQNATPIDVTQVQLAPKSVPGYYLFSAMLQHPLTDHLTFQVNVNNLTNKFYIDEPHPNHLVPGEAVNAQFNVSYKF